MAKSGRITLLAWFIFLQCPYLSFQKACADKAFLYKKVCLWIIDAKLDYNGAEQACAQTTKGRLAIVRDKYLAIHLKTLLENRHPFNAFWLGMTDRHTEGKWVHSDGTLVTEEEFKDIWEHGKPVANTKENCGVMFDAHASFALGDENCTQTFSAVCETVAAVPSRLRECPKDSLPYEERCFFKTDIETNYAGAIRSCQAKGSRVAILKDTFLHSLLKELAKRKKSDDRTVWVGMAVVNGEWMYADGQLVTDKHMKDLWVKDERGGPREKCGVMFGNVYQYLLGDENCHKRYTALCELFVEKDCRHHYKYFEGFCYKVVRRKRQTTLKEEQQYCSLQDSRAFYGGEDENNDEFLNDLVWSRGYGYSKKRYFFCRYRACSFGWTPYKDRCLSFTKTKHSFYTSMEECEDKGGRLATVDNEDAFHFFKLLIVKAMPKDMRGCFPAWVGLSKSQSITRPKSTCNGIVCLKESHVVPEDCSTRHIALCQI